MRVWTCDHCAVELPPWHRFPMQKYALLRRALVDGGVLAASELRAAEPIEPAALTAVHAVEYVDAFTRGTLDGRAMGRIGFPWSQALVQRTLASAGATSAAARAALEDGMAGALAGGTHHAHADFGAGFCVFNDIAVAARALLDAGRVGRVLVLDLDVHQGDGTAAIFAREPRVVTCSLHGARNFPARKAQSDLDVALADGTDDAAYLAALADALEHLFALPGPPFDIAFYQGGVDPLAEDRLGRLALTHVGLERRDALALGALRARAIPVVLTLGGGYADPIELSIRAHVNTYRVAKALET